jgi:hypothetical protein
MYDHHNPLRGLISIRLQSNRILVVWAGDERYLVVVTINSTVHIVLWSHIFEKH